MASTISPPLPASDIITGQARSDSESLGGWLLFDDAQRVQHKDSIEWLNKTASVPSQLVWQPGDIETAVDRLTLAWVKI